MNSEQGTVTLNRSTPVRELDACAEVCMPFRVLRSLASVLCAGALSAHLFASSSGTAVASAEPGAVSAPRAYSSSLAPWGAGIELVRPEPPDPCVASEVIASPTRPSWDNSAITTQCGVLESDFGYQWQSMGGGLGQRSIPSSVRYGITPKLDMRWGMGGHQWQSGDDVVSVDGDGDHWLSARYRYHEQGRMSPALALGYGYKIPVANPGKGFGTGHADHQLLFLASRDIGQTHVDFSIVGTFAGAKYGHDDAAQLG